MRRTLARLIANSRLASVVSIFPVIRDFSVTEDKLDQLGEACFGANVTSAIDGFATTTPSMKNGIRASWRRVKKAARHEAVTKTTRFVLLD